MTQKKKSDKRWKVSSPSQCRLRFCIREKTYESLIRDFGRRAVKVVLKHRRAGADVQCAGFAMRGHPCLHL